MQNQTQESYQFYTVNLTGYGIKKRARKESHIWEDLGLDVPVKDFNDNTIDELKSIARNHAAQNFKTFRDLKIRMTFTEISNNNGFETKTFKLLDDRHKTLFI